MLQFFHGLVLLVADAFDVGVQFRRDLGDHPAVGGEFQDAALAGAESFAGGAAHDIAVVAKAAVVAAVIGHVRRQIDELPRSLGPLLHGVDRPDEFPAFARLIVFKNSLPLGGLDAFEQANEYLLGAVLPAV